MARLINPKAEGLGLALDTMAICRAPAAGVKGKGERAPDFFWPWTGLPPYTDLEKGDLMQHFVSTSLIFVLALAAPACAQSNAGVNDSAYVRVFDDCTTRESEEDPVFFSDCTGYGDWTVHILAGEHGAAVAYSRRGLEAQWSENPPRVGVFQDLGQVMEWRLNGSGQPFATIYRSVFTGYEAGDGGQYLTVSALRSEGELGACHVAYIEAAQQPNANQIARDAADYLAPDWQCGVEEPIVFDLDSEMDVLTVAAQRRPGH
tara:strand:- start:1174 stop:1956 length:783 start_codon:yes stop_codon:yes gene_type:complete